MKKLVTEYTFDASAQTISSPEFVDLKKILLITNLTDGIDIFDPARPTLGGTLSNGTLTLEYNTTTMSNTDDIQIFVWVGTGLERIGFTKTIAANGVDTDFFTLRQTGTGMGVSQTGGELVITSGTTARAETIIRSNRAFTGGIRARITSRLSQRIVNQQFIYEMVDVVGDGLAYTINSATSITVTFPASYGLSSQDVGRSVTLCQFSGTGTFLSGRYPIASVSGNDATITVSGFAAGLGTVSVVGLNGYRLLYDGATATLANFDVARGGYLWSQKPGGGNAPAIITLTSASPGHQAIITANDGVAYIQDQLTANATTNAVNDRGQRITNIPDDQRLFLQIRVLNLATAPASTTTWNIEQVSVAYFEPESIVVQDVRPTNFAAALPVRPMAAGPTQPVSGSVTVTGTVTANSQNFSPTIFADVASAAITTTTTTTSFTPTGGNGYQLSIPVTAVSGTNPLLVVTIEESMDSGTNWFPRCTFRCAATANAASTATGIYYSPYLKLKGNRVRYVQTITGGTPSITRAINRFQGQAEMGEGVPYKLISAASTNATLVKAGPTTISMLTGSNINAAARYLKIYDKATAPTVGTDEVAYTFILPGFATGAGTNIPLARELNLMRGFGLALTTGVADTDTGAVAANEQIINCQIS